MSATADAEPSLVVDARGLSCPLPIIRLARTSAGLPPGTLVAVRWTDPAARYDVPAWARMRGHEVVATETDVVDADPGMSGSGSGSAWVTTVRLG